MIKIDNLKKQFGQTTACDIPSFVVNDGDILGLVGNNGAGKTTLFRLLLDLLRADDGTVTYVFSEPAASGTGAADVAAAVTAGGTGAADVAAAVTADQPVTRVSTPVLTVNPTESEAWKEHVGAYIDNSFLIDFLTPEEYFAFLGKVAGLSTSQVDERLSVFERFAGGEIFGQKKLIRNLSGGNMMKVGIMSALLRRPATVILDEPFNFLDPTSQVQLKHLLVDYVHETGATVLVSSHNLAHTVDISTRIALLEHGRIIRDLPNTAGSAAAELQEYFGTE